MIEVIYDGNLGNNLFQYCFARILAETLGYRLVARPIPGFPRTYDVVDGAYYPDAEMIILRGQKPNLSFLNEAKPEYYILLTGYFQRYEYYQSYSKIIKQWLTTDKELSNMSVDEYDVVVGIRRGRDYIPRHGLPISYYENALSLLKPNRVFICTDVPSDPFVKHLQRRYNATIRSPGALDNLLFIKEFDKIIISNSTFLWWAAFLSDATKIIFPRPANGYWSHNDILSKNMALEVDESRYIYLECEQYRSEFFAEQLANLTDKLNAELRRGLKKSLPFSRSRSQPCDIDNRYIFSEDFDGE